MMKHIAFSILLVILTLASCGGSDEESSILTPKYVDISSFTLFTGSADGGKEIVFNNVKWKDLTSEYFDTVYKPRLYSNVTLDFNGNKLTYSKYSGEIGQSSGFKIIGDYYFRNDSLFIIKADKTEILVAEGNSPNLLYRKRGMVRYPLSAGKDTIYAIDEHLNLEKVLKLANYNSIEDLKDPDAIIAWCNMIYLFD